MAEKPATKPQVLTISLANRDQEYSQLFPNGIKRFSMQCDTDVDVRFAFVTGKVAGSTRPYATMRAGSTYYEDDVSMNSVVIYLASSTPGSDGAGGYTKGEGIFDDKNGLFLKVVGGTNSITQICSSVISEGGSQDLGISRYISTTGTHLDVNTENTLYALLGLRLKSEYIGTSIKILNASIQMQSASHRCEWVILLNPTIAGSPSWSSLSQSAVQYFKGATANTVTGGYEFTGGFVESGGVASGGAGNASRGIDNAVLIGSLIDGTVDELVLCVRPIGGSSNVDVEGAINWREIV